MEYVFSAPSDPGFRELCRLLDDFLNRAAGGEARRAEYLPLNTADGLCDLLLAREGASVCGCAGLRPLEGEAAELKRFFVREEFRGRGIGKELLRRLEARARERGFSELLLETGELLAAAMALYRAAGYAVTENYGPYRGLPDSVCMRKAL